MPGRPRQLNLSGGGGGGPGSDTTAFHNGGDAFGATAKIGTTDANDLTVKLNGVDLWQFTQGGGLFPLNTGFGIGSADFPIDFTAFNVGLYNPGDINPSLNLSVGHIQLGDGVSTPDIDIYRDPVTFEVMALTPSGTYALTPPSGGSSSPLTTKGDVWTYSTVNARLAVGANNTVLMADSSAATGNKWAAMTDAILSTSDITTNDVSSTKHGFAPKSPANALKVLNGATSPAYVGVLSLFPDTETVSAIDYTMDFITNDANQQGIHLKRSTTGQPLGLTLWSGGTKYWGAPAMDFVTTDLVLAFDIQAGSDVIRMNQGTGQVGIGWKLSGTLPPARLSVLCGEDSSDSSIQRGLHVRVTANASSCLRPVIIESPVSDELLQLSNATAGHFIGLSDAGSSPSLWLGQSDTVGLQVKYDGTSYANGAFLGFQGCRVYSAIDLHISDSTFTSVLFDTERYDVGGFHSTASNTNRLTMPATGTYEFGFEITFNTSAVGIRYVSIYTDAGVQIGTYQVDPVASGLGTRLVAGGIPYALAAAAWVEIQVYQNSGGTLDLVSGGANGIEFWCRRVA